MVAIKQMTRLGVAFSRFLFIGVDRRYKFMLHLMFGTKNSVKVDRLSLQILSLSHYKNS
jgi:hypothetical protein